MLSAVSRENENEPPVRPCLRANKDMERWSEDAGNLRFLCGLLS